MALSVLPADQRRLGGVEVGLVVDGELLNFAQVARGFVALRAEKTASRLRSSGF
jgi:hypothetical protein